jgi:hypothetical protein
VAVLSIGGPDADIDYYAGTAEIHDATARRQAADVIAPGFLPDPIPPASLAQPSPQDRGH